MNPSRTLFPSLAAVALALLVAGCSKPSEASPEATRGTPGASSPALEGRHIDVTVGPGGYTPSTIEAKQGEALVLRFNRTTKGECLAQVVFPDLKITRDLPLNTPVEVAIKAEKPGKIAFQCGMAMVHGSINVSGS
jgi:plastocyanin domain-containing protein